MSPTEFTHYHTTQNQKTFTMLPANSTNVSYRTHYKESLWTPGHNQFSFPEKPSSSSHVKAKIRAFDSSLTWVTSLNVQSLKSIRFSSSILKPSGDANQHPWASWQVTNEWRTVSSSKPHNGHNQGFKYQSRSHCNFIAFVDITANHEQM